MIKESPGVPVNVRVLPKRPLSPPSQDRVAPVGTSTWESAPIVIPTGPLNTISVTEYAVRAGTVITPVPSCFWIFGVIILGHLSRSSNSSVLGVSLYVRFPG